MPENYNTELSEDVNDILSRMPNWMVRWGLTLIMGLIIASFILSYVIKYPEVIEGKVVITTTQPPVKLTAKSNLVIKKIHYDNQEFVARDSVIVEFEHPTSLEEIRKLEKSIKKLQQIITEPQGSSIQLSFTNLIIGEKQSTLGQLQKKIEDYNQFVQINEFNQKIAFIQERIKYREEYGRVIEKLSLSAGDRLADEKQSYEIKKELYEQKITPKMQFLEEKVQYLSKKDQLEEYKKSIIQNNMSIQDDKMLVLELESQKQERVADYRSSIFQLTSDLESYIEQWYQSYTIVAPRSGQLNYLRNFHANQYVAMGDNLFAIVTNNSSLRAYSYMPSKGFGKVKKDQRVKIKLDNYPYEEFGYLFGNVKDISQIPNDEEYLTIIELQKGLKTSYNKELDFSAEITGTAEIVTEDLRLIDRLFNQLQKIEI